ncbi:sugar translocase [Paraburkholderia sp. SUR17]|uniref:sugar translocase n=1 Tax=Paraburkholderia sp. SUR17 TaxID=3034358 RepID=UPI002408053C|nr:sugar translocase [Paraburkholderia sp. SUR17]WEY39430.1 sugar translocase [Paraburkholderia sp. SUR17]
MTDFAFGESPSTRSPAKSKAVSLGAPCALGAVSLLVGWMLMGGRHIDIRVPLIYNGDGLLMLLVIKRLMENLWVFHSGAMGAPFGSYLYDYPIPDSGSLAALKVFGVLSGSAATALNIYYLIGFPLNALSAYFVARRFHLSRALSFSAGFIFTMLPFHFLRLPHLFYTWYFPAPLFIWYAYKIYVGNLFSSDKSRGLSGQIGHVATLLVLSCFGVYYSFFGVLAFLAATLCKYLRVRSIISIFPGILAVAIVTIGIVANVAPNLADRARHEINTEVAQRNPSEAELYGLKITQLLLPRVGHRMAPLAELTQKYTTTFPLVNENETASLGAIGSVGFLALLLALIAPGKAQRRDERLYFLAAITFVLVLFCTIGGGSALFSILISPMIRAWNRVSVFIAFTSICAAMLITQLGIERYAPRLRATWPAIGGIGAILCAIAIWDQTTPPCQACNDATRAEYLNDARFIGAIETESPKGSAIYQLPYVRFPEALSVGGVQSYDQARGYLHSASLGWSYGAMKGRAADLFFRALAEAPLERQIEVARRIGFSGIYIDRRGYADGGAAIEAELTRLLGGPPDLISDNKRQVFYKLTRNGVTVAPVPAGLSVDQIITRAGFVAR